MALGASGAVLGALSSAAVAKVRRGPSTVGRSGGDGRRCLKISSRILKISHRRMTSFDRHVRRGSSPEAHGRFALGARQAKVEEPLAWVEEYPIQWREPRVDLAELAKLRWIEGLSRQELAERYGKTTVAIQNYFQQLRRINFRIPGLSDNERAQILLESKN